MDRLNYLRECVQKLLMDYKNLRESASAQNYIEVENIFDTERDHYLLILVGWEDFHRTYGCVLHMDIKNSKIWVQYNGTEIDVVNELLEMGVSKQEIVIGFHSPFKRQYTDFAVS